MINHFAIECYGQTDAFVKVCHALYEFVFIYIIPFIFRYFSDKKTLLNGFFKIFHRIFFHKSHTN